MTTLLLAYSIIHDFLITPAILNGGRITFLAARARVWARRRAEEEDSGEETAGGTTVYPILWVYVW